MRYLQVNDVHMSDQPPRMRTASYRDDILDKLAAVMQIALDREVDAVVFTGDMFHRQNPAHTSHRTVQDVNAILTGVEVPIYIVPGNHDYRRGSYAATDGQPLRSVTGDDVHILDGRAEADPHICGIPWADIMEGPDGITWISEAGPLLNNAGDVPPLVFAHAPVTLEPYPFGPERAGWIMADELAATLPPEVRLFAHGHMHKGHAPSQHERNGRDYLRMSNPGALSRATIADDDTGRVPQVALITLDEHLLREPEYAVQVDYIEVSHRPASEVFRVAVAEAAGERAEGIAALAQAMASADTHTVTADTLIDLLGRLERPEDVPEADWDAGLAMARAAVEDASA